MDDQPAIDQIPGTVLGDVVAHRTRAWGGEPVPVPPAVTVALWLVLVANLGVGGWLSAVRFAVAPCSGWLCTVATWNHPGFLLVLACVCTALLVAVAAVSRGLTEVTPVLLGAASGGALCGMAAIAGVLALLLIAAAAAGVAMAALVTAIERI